MENSSGHQPAAGLEGKATDETAYKAVANQNVTGLIFTLLQQSTNSCRDKCSARGGSSAPSSGDDRTS